MTFFLMSSIWSYSTKQSNKNYLTLQVVITNWAKHIIIINNLFILFILFFC